MAEGDRSQKQVFHFHIHNTSTEETVIQEQNVGNRTDIHGCKIGSVLTGQSEQGAEEDASGEDGVIAEGVEHMNLARTSKTSIFRPQKWLGKRKEKGSDMKPAGGKAGQRMSDEKRTITVSFLKERISVLLWQSKHFEASKLVEELETLQPTVDLGTSLQMAECLLHLGRESEAYETIDTVRHIIVSSRALKANDVFTLGYDLCKNSSFVRAIILLRIASDLCRTDASPPNDIVNSIYYCIRETHYATQLLIKAGGRSLVIGLDFGVEYMKQMFDYLSDVKNAEPGNKALRQVDSLEIVGLSYELAKEYEKSLKPRLTGVEILKSQFGSDASKYKVYRVLLNNIGVAYDNLGKFLDAEKYHLKLIRVYQRVRDWPDDSQKQRSVERAKSNLKNTRAKLGKK